MFVVFLNYFDRDAKEANVDYSGYIKELHFAGDHAVIDFEQSYFLKSNTFYNYFFFLFPRIFCRAYLWLALFLYTRCTLNRRIVLENGDNFCTNAI